MLHAALLLTVWVLLSGALHLDGLADSADAWLGGFGDRERTLTIMKDPRSGPIAVVTLVLVLLLKFAALLALIEQQHGACADHRAVDWSQCVAGVVPDHALCAGRWLGAGAGRSSAALGRQAGVGGQWLGLRADCWLEWCFCAWCWQSLVFVWLRQVMLRRLGGTTGDTAGALLELLEVAVLVGLALDIRLREQGCSYGCM